VIKLIRTNSDHADFIELVRLLDAYLTIVDGEDHSFYNQYNSIENLKYVIVAFDNGEAVGCGAIKSSNSTSMEVKRMFVQPAARGKGLAKKILSELEQWAQELGFEKCILETGRRMEDAVTLYKKCGYEVIPNFEPYTKMENSICFEKRVPGRKGALN
jgi:GNAT superfamily N-acetyltransferase